MRGSRTTHLIFAGALGLAALVGLASPAFAETPAQDGDEMVLVFGEGDTGTSDDKAPVPQPDPEPGPGEISDGPNDPGPDPLPEDQPEIGLPDEPSDPGDGPDGPGEVTSDPGCTFTHGCEPECDPQLGSCDITDQPDGGDDGDDPVISDGGDCIVGCQPDDGGDEPGQPDGHCFDEAGEVVDVSECMPTDEPGGEGGTDGGDESTDVLGSSTERSALPRTGAGLAALAAAGMALVAAGATARQAAKR